MADTESPKTDEDTTLSLKEAQRRLTALCKRIQRKHPDKYPHPTFTNVIHPNGARRVLFSCPWLPNTWGHSLDDLRPPLIIPDTSKAVNAHQPGKECEDMAEEGMDKIEAWSKGGALDYILSLDPSAPAPTTKVDMLREVYRRTFLPDMGPGIKLYNAAELSPDKRYEARCSCWVYDGAAVRHIVTMERGSGGSDAELNAVSSVLAEVESIARRLGVRVR